MTKTYAGIGARDTPDRVLRSMKLLGSRLATLGFILNSGGAKGADTAFESGARDANGQVNIFLPYKSFNLSQSKLYSICDRSIKMAKYYHPRGENLNGTSLKFMARNCYQVLGQDLITPVDFIICWTPNGKIEGGTGQAMRIAKDRDIPIFNLHESNSINKLHSYLKILGVQGIK